MTKAQTRQSHETFLKDSHAFSGFSVKNTATAKAFYADRLGLDASEYAEMGILILHLRTTTNRRRSLFSIFRSII